MDISNGETNHKRIPLSSNQSISPHSQHTERTIGMTTSALLRKTDIPFEIVILLIAGMALLITGILLFPVSSGALPYYENGLSVLVPEVSCSFCRCYLPKTNFERG
jgi:hypothetical protein